jgi:hypothetical protein
MRKFMLVALALAALAGGACAAEDATSAPRGIETDSGNTENPPPEDIDAGWECTIDRVGWSTAQGTLTNHSSGMSNYMVEVSFTDSARVHYASGTAFVNNVAAGAQGEWEANSLTDARPGTTCTIVSVDRYAS